MSLTSGLSAQPEPRGRRAGLPASAGPLGAAPGPRGSPAARRVAATLPTGKGVGSAGRPRWGPGPGAPCRPRPSLAGSPTPSLASHPLLRPAPTSAPHDCPLRPRWPWRVVAAPPLLAAARQVSEAGPGGGGRGVGWGGSSGALAPRPLPRAERVSGAWSRGWSLGPRGQHRTQRPCPSGKRRGAFCLSPVSVGCSGNGHTKRPADSSPGCWSGGSHTCPLAQRPCRPGSGGGGAGGVSL